MSNRIINKTIPIREIIKYATVLLFPLILCALYCLVRGTSLTELYVPDSYNSDSFFYYKMVQGVLENGLPKGYFGYNESQALVGSFGVWSPLILIPWALWGIVFGWGYTSVFAANIVYFSLALAFFVWITRMEWKGIVSMLVILSLIPSLPLHLLSCLPETNLLAVVLVYFGLAVGMQDTERKRLYLILMYALCVILTIIRPFMILLLIAPGYYFYKEKGKKTFLLTLGIACAGMGLYFLGSHFFSAPYFDEMFDFSIVENVLHGQFGAAFAYVWECVKRVLPTFLRYIKRAFTFGLTAGTQYVVAIVTAMLSGYHVFFDKKSKLKPVHFMLIAMDVALIASMILLHGKVNEGGRHIFAFAIAGCVLCCLERGKVSYGVKGVFGVMLIVMICRGALVPTDYDIPIRTERIAENVEYWEKAFREKGVTLSEHVGWENTVIWCDCDYNELYALPSGVGVSCCFSGHIIENYVELKSRFIAISPESQLDEMCSASGFLEIGRTEEVVIYQRY